MKTLHAARGLKSSTNIRDPKVALREWRLMLETVENSEDEMRMEGELLGDACKQVRESRGFTQARVAAGNAFTLAEIKQLEKLCRSDVAKRYIRALETL